MCLLIPTVPFTVPTFIRFYFPYPAGRTLQRYNTSIYTFAMLYFNETNNNRLCRGCSLLVVHTASVRNPPLAKRCERRCVPEDLM